jgi:hypothetical protein
MLLEEESLESSPACQSTLQGAVGTAHAGDRGLPQATVRKCPAEVAECVHSVVWGLLDVELLPQTDRLRQGSVNLLPNGLGAA